MMLEIVFKQANMMLEIVFNHGKIMCGSRFNHGNMMLEIVFNHVGKCSTSMGKCSICMVKLRCLIKLARPSQLGTSMGKCSICMVKLHIIGTLFMNGNVLMMVHVRLNHGNIILANMSQPIVHHPI